MMIIPAGVKVHLALGHTDMRKRFEGLAMLVQRKQLPSAVIVSVFQFEAVKVIIAYELTNGPRDRKFHDNL